MSSSSLRGCNNDQKKYVANWYAEIVWHKSEDNEFRT